MQTIGELRKALKVIGYTIKTKSYSYGVHATYETIEGNKLTYNVFTPDTLIIWKPLFDWKNEHKEELRELREITGIYGLM